MALKIRPIPALWFAVFAGASIAALAIPAHDAWEAAQAREMHLDELEKAALVSPYNGRLHALLGARRLQAGDFLAASRALRSAATSGEDRASVRLSWAASLAAANQERGAVAVLQTGKQPELAAALTRLSALPPDATGITQAATISPDNSALLFSEYARPNIFSRFVTPGLATAEEQYEKSNKTRKETLQWCEVLLRNKRYAEARERVEPFLAAESVNEEVRLVYADALRGLKLPYKAAREYIQVVRANEKSLRALVGTGEMALDAGIFPLAIEAFTRATVLAPNSIDAWIGLGKARLKQGISYASTIEAFEKAAKLAPKRTDYFVPYSNALRMAFRWEQAEKLLRQRLANAPEDAEAYHFLATCLQDGSRATNALQEAEPLFKRSLELEPDGVTTAAKLGLLYVSQDRMEEAIPLLRMVLNRNRYDLATTQALARALRKMGKMQEYQVVQTSANELATYLTRRSYLNDRLRVEPTNIALHLQLATLLADGGEEEIATRHRRMAEELRRNPQQAVRDLYMLTRSTAQGIQVPISSSFPITTSK